MANRRQQGRRMDYGRPDMDHDGAFNRSSGVSPWQGGSGPSNDIPNLLPLSGNPTEATLALANNLISNLLQNRTSNVPSLLDMPMRRDFPPSMQPYERGFSRDMPSTRMGNQGSFRRSGSYNRNGVEMHTMRKPYRPYEVPRRQQAQKKDADKSKTASKQESQKESKDSTETPNKGETPKKMTYDDLSSDLLKCHICNKSMWDGRSFENHLNGRAHAIMMQKAAESYALTADTMRQEFKIREMKFNRRSGINQTSHDFYCAMCDLYAAEGVAHRNSPGHRKLKKYLHPNCVICHKELSTRIDLDEHRFTIEHLANTMGEQGVVHGDTKERKPRPQRPEVVTLSTLSMEQAWIRDGRRKNRRSGVAAQAKQEGAEKAENKGENDAEQTEAETPAVKTEESLEVDVKPDSEKTVVDYTEGDDLTTITKEDLPLYNPTRGVGRSFLQPFNCIECKLCHKLLDCEETAETHLKTWRHHQLFVKMLKENSNIKADENKARATAKVAVKEENGDDGNWKRRKLEDDKKVDPKDELYDPEANDDEDEQEDWEEQLDEILEDTAADGNDETNGTEADESTLLEETEQDTSVADEETPQEADDQNTTVDNTPEPTFTAPAPADNTPKPTVNTPTPVVKTPTPAVNTPTPAVNTPTPAVNTPNRGRGGARGRGRRGRRGV